MPRKTHHFARIEYLSAMPIQGKDQPQYCATCTCGWHSMPTRLAEVAHCDADEHARNCREP